MTTITEINSFNRDEFIYTKLFNNHAIPTDIHIDYTLGSCEEWLITCNKFNNGEMILDFALIYMINDKLVCDNIHPFLEKNNGQMSEIIDLFHAHKINN